MLITRFNRMIRNKWLWGFFAVVVCIIFVFSFAPRGTGASKDLGTEGSLYGKPVSEHEFMLAQKFELEMRDDVSLTPKQRRTLRKNAWRRLAVIKTAKRMGIKVSRDEVDQLISADRRFFDESGNFSRQMYQRYFQSFGQRETSQKQMYRLYQQQNAVLSKVITALLSSLWISPFEIDMRLRRILDSFVLKYAAFDFKDFAKPVELTDEMAKKYYEENKILFEEPTRIRIAYIEFPISNYYGNIQIDDDAIREYYRDHLYDYISVTTNDTNSVSVTQALETVSSDISENLRTMDASFEAKFQATQFSLKLGESDTGTNLLRSAEPRGLSGGITDFFADGEPVSGIKANDDFYKAAFALDPASRNRNISDAVLTGDGAYVLSCVDISERHVPDFEAVSNDVAPLAMSNAVHEAFIASVQGIRESIESMLESNVSFEAAVSTYDVNAGTTTSFIIGDGPSTNAPDYVISLVPELELLTKGELTGVVSVGDKAVIGYVTDREAGDPTMAHSYGQRVSWFLTSHRIQMLYHAFGDYLLDQADFEDNHPMPPLTEDEKAESEADM